MTSKMRTPALSLAVALLTWTCGGGEKEGAAAARLAPVEVQVQASAAEEVEGRFEVGGVVRARTTATLVSRIVGDVREVLVSPDDRVRAGQALVRLDARELAANRSSAESALAAAERRLEAAIAAREGAQAALALARATHSRIAELHSRKSATPHELDEAASALRAAESREKSAEVSIREAEAASAGARAALQGAGVGLSYATISAPFDGLVTEKHVEPGNMAAPGTPLVTVEDPSGFRLELSVDEGRVAHLDQARSVDVVVDTLSRPGGRPESPRIEGRISEVARALDPGSHAFLVKVQLPGDLLLRSGMFGRALLPGPRRHALVIPSSSVVRRGQVTSVFVVGADDTAQLRLVSLGVNSDGRTEVAAGLDEGERVVVSPPPSLRDGAAVRVVGSAASGAGRPEEGR
jgi:multidrug efflux pump subunit AcrA (membrane-fusion protein)